MKSVSIPIAQTLPINWEVGSVSVKFSVTFIFVPIEGESVCVDNTEGVFNVILEPTNMVAADLASIRSVSIIGIQPLVMFAKAVLIADESEFPVTVKLPVIAVSLYIVIFAPGVFSEIESVRTGPQTGPKRVPNKFPKIAWAVRFPLTVTLVPVFG